jgi:hypothetical protein
MQATQALTPPTRKAPLRGLLGDQDFVARLSSLSRRLELAPLGLPEPGLVALILHLPQDREIMRRHRRLALGRCPPESA